MAANRISQKWRWIISVGMSFLKCWFPPCLLLDHLLWGKPASMSWTLWRNWGLLSTTDINLPAIQVSWLGSRSLSHSQAFKCLDPWPTSWLQPHERYWARTTQLSHLLIPDTKKLGKILLYLFPLRIIFIKS